MSRQREFKNLFMLSVRTSSYGCTRKVWRARVARGAAESNSSFLSALQTSQVHPQLDIRTAKSMSKFFYNRVTMNKKILRHLIYARACVNKDFVRSGSIRLI